MSQSNTDTTPVAGRILHEDNHIVVVNKLPGELAQGDDTGDEPLLEKVREYIRVKYCKPGNVFCGLVHRLDRPVSGAIVFAKTSKALTRLNEMVKDRNFSKHYWAVVEGRPRMAEARLEHYLKRNPANNRTLVSCESLEGWKRAELEYSTLASSDRYSLLEVRLHTGRHHQIRAQLAHIGNPIKGDVKYGARRAELDRSICLHARKISFTHPVSKELLSIVAEPFNPLFINLIEKNAI
ncbi:MAG: RNA pseudouridine synthase [Bacteroidales bacterium]|nr:RNA pseudouridine synthase [Bacteroidales bacterium]MDY6348265.1 RNA pseudouridine synthase [Bacteroidales bacterium]